MGQLNKGDQHKEHEAFHQHIRVWAPSQAHIH